VAEVCMPGDLTRQAGWPMSDATRAECPIRRCLGHPTIVTIGPLNRPLTCIVTVTAGYLGTYSAYVEQSGLP
jgi:hypothetical protein